MRDIDYKLLVKILIEWSIKNKQYDMTYFMYSNFNIGIPVKFLYNLEDKNIFFSLSSFINGNDTKHTSDENLKKLSELFRKSKYKQLIEWKNNYGYSLF
jgi:hypothetical protein